MIASPNVAQFLAELETLCKKHKIQLEITGETISCFDLEEGDECMSYFGSHPDRTKAFLHTEGSRGNNLSETLQFSF